jgi:hypothetical protein
VNPQPPDHPAPKLPDKKCRHEQFHIAAQCHRICQSDAPNAVPYLFTAELVINCVQCGGSFQFEEIPWQINLKKPCVNVTRTVVALPMKPWDGMMATGTCHVTMPEK